MAAAVGARIGWQRAWLGRDNLLLMVVYKMAAEVPGNVSAFG